MPIFFSKHIVLRALLPVFVLVATSHIAYSQDDSTAVAQMRKELELVKTLRQKDSIKIVLLLEEFRNLMQAEKALVTDSDSKTDSVLLKQKEEIEKLRGSIKGVPVVFYADTLFSVHTSLGPYNAELRVKNIHEKLNQLYHKPFFFSDSLKVKNTNGFLNINYQDEIITGITLTDALWAGVSMEELADRHTEAIKKTIVKYRKENSLKNNLLRIGELLLILTVFIGIIWVINRLFKFIETSFFTPNNRFLRRIAVRNYELLSKERLLVMFCRVLFIIKVLLIFLLLITVIPIAFSIFPSTQNWSETIREWVWDPVKLVGAGILGYLPKLMTIIVIIVIARYLLRLLRFFSLEIERGVLTIRGFYPEWARTTYLLVRFAFLILVLVFIFPYLPGSDSDVFKGVSVFLGILISIGSSSAIANAIAGLVITYMRSFKLGDWIKTDGVTGVVIEKNALVTRLKTINNEDVSVPNSAVLSGATINYTSIGCAEGLVIAAQVKVRYDYPYDIVEKLLLDAALQTKDISEKPHPYVFQLALEDINAVYEINAFTFVPHNMYFIKSDLIKNIQDVFRKAGVEIFSTQYIEIRTAGEKTKK